MKLYRRFDASVKLRALSAVVEETAPARETSLEERVEALETKVEGEEGEGFVQPRTGA